MFDDKSDDTIFDNDYRNFDDGIANDDKMNGDKICRQRYLQKTNLCKCNK